MRHLAVIQSEFLKVAREWDEMTLDEQRDYLRQHPASDKRLTAKPDNVQPEQESKTISSITNEQIPELKIGIKKSLEKLYTKLNLTGRFDSIGFDLTKDNDKLLVDIPYLSTTRNEMFSKKMSDESKSIVLKYLKKLGIHKKKSDFKYEKRADGPFSASTYSLK